MPRRKDPALRGHSPQQYTRDSRRFQELVNKCPHVVTAGPGRYCNVGGRGFRTTFKPHRVPNMLAARFQDGEAAYDWHIIIKEVSPFECAQEIEPILKRWKKNIKVIYHNFEEEKDDQMDNSPQEDHTAADLNLTPAPPSVLPYTNGSADAHTVPVYQKEHTDEESQLLVVSHDWAPEESWIYYALVEEAKEGKNPNAEYFPTHANFTKGEAVRIAEQRTPVSKTKIKAIIRDILDKKLNIWQHKNLERFQARLLFVQEVKQFPFPEPETPAPPAQEIISVPHIDAPYASAEVTRHTPAFLVPSGTMLAAILQVIQDTHQPLHAQYQEIAAAYEAVMKKIRQHNGDIAWILDTTNGQLTPEQRDALQAQMIR
ncbi:MAG: hypothetical protein Q8R30_04575 [bacterium]|nr:hypothetical protein [bacterium]MDZ4285464.1 hypothetical protein [Candidatus Sungbacteria bacterium]